MATPELFDETESRPFNPDDYVERLSWLIPGAGTKADTSLFNPQVLYNEFVGHINQLKDLDAKLQKRVEKLEETAEREAVAHTCKVNELHKSNQLAFSHLQSLEDRINYVATKVMHLGDQLEGINTPRTHAAEALKLMRYFDEFLSDTFESSVFMDPGKTREAADIINKLHLIAQELPFTGFANVKSKIVQKYHEIEGKLLEDFKYAHRGNDTEEMKSIASVLSQFKGYQHCTDAFIEESLKSGFSSQYSIFDEASHLCQKVYPQILSIFSSPEQVMGKLVTKIYQGRINDHIVSRLREVWENKEQFLKELRLLYGDTMRLSEELSNFNIGSDSNFLAKLTKSIYRVSLSRYIEVEEEFLKEKAASILQRFYDSKNHTKKQFNTGMQDFKAVISDKTNIRFGLMSSSNANQFACETFLQEELAINLLQETKMAFGRCAVLSSTHTLASNATCIFDILLEYLCKQHIQYAADFGLSMVPTPEPRLEPNIYFLDVVEQANTIFHLFEKQFSDTLLPMVNSSPKYSVCNQKKKKIRENLEKQLDSGIDKCMTSIIGWMKQILKNEQKKTDFSSNELPQQQCTRACSQLCKYVEKVTQMFQKCLDGNNIKSVLKEFGCRYHKLLYDHLQQYTFSSCGAMMVICDVKRYNQCALILDDNLTIQLFDNLHSLCNLLIVAPENMREVCSKDNYANLNRTILHSFVQLRCDYRSARLAKIFS